LVLIANLNLRHLYLAPPLGDAVGISQRSLGYCTTLFAWFYV